MSVKVLNGPTGNVAKQLLSGVWQKIQQKDPKKVSVTIEDSVEDRLKTIQVDVSKGNILENIFIRQKSLGTFTPDIRLCEPSIRIDLISEMKGKLI
ncbi:hypothetical protein [Roseovarius aestuarii]|uniref:hypothetical protein n=1 Tax=Roseovarius aestuarii TaxID=475083 RepID=UPI001593B57B|nr:hypothetical protein [Roseovarius aestuarii]